MKSATSARWRPGGGHARPSTRESAPVSLPNRARQRNAGPRPSRTCRPARQHGGMGFRFRPVESARAPSCRGEVPPKRGHRISSPNKHGLREPGCCIRLPAPGLCARGRGTGGFPSRAPGPRPLPPPQPRLLIEDADRPLGFPGPLIRGKVAAHERLHIRLPSFRKLAERCRGNQPPLPSRTPGCESARQNSFP